MANDFSGDSNVQGLWNFESSALTTDDSGEGNTLATGGTPAEDTVNYKQGSCSVDLELSEGDYLYRLDGDLSADFPFKSGDTAKLGSIGFWCKPESSPGSGTFCVCVCKWKDGSSGNKNSIWLGLNNGRFRFAWGYSATQAYWHDLRTITAGRWYYVLLAVDGVNKNWGCYIWDDTAQTWASYGETEASVLYVGDGMLGIGGDISGGYFDGLFDEVVIFDRVLSSLEADAIRQGIYDEYITMFQIFAEVEYDETPQVRMFQEFAEVEYAEYDGIEVYQNLVQVEYAETPGIEVYQLLAQIEYDPNIRPLVVTSQGMEVATEIDEPALTEAFGKIGNFFLVFH